MKDKFGTEIKQIDLDTVVQAYNATDEDAKAETDRWIKGARRGRASRKEIFKSCKLALAFENMLADEEATVMTVDCYGTMWDKTIKLPAYPCLGFCAAQRHGPGRDLRVGPALRHDAHHPAGPDRQARLHQRSDRGRIDRQHHPGPLHGLAEDGRPERTAAPVQDSARSTSGRKASRRRVQMRKGQKVTQAILIGTDQMLYFTGEIIDAPVAWNSTAAAGPRSP